MSSGRARVWIDGAPVDPDRARVSVFDRGFLYGDSVYEVTRALGGVPFALAEHLDRLERSAAGLAIALPPREAIAAAVHETLAASGLGDAYVRIVVSRGQGELGLDPALAGPPSLVVIVLPSRLPPAAAYREGVAVAIVARGRLDPEIKSGNYVSSVLALAEAHGQGAYEALLIDSVGRVTEGSSSNLFLARGGRVATPPVASGLLAGITRQKVLALLAEEGIPAIEQPLWPLDLYGADEAFLTSAMRGVVPVVRVDGRQLGEGVPGPLTLRAMRAYEALLAATTGGAVSPAR